MDYRTKYARLHFGDGGKLDLHHPTPLWEQAAVEERWRLVNVRIEWLLSPRGRLDRALSYVASSVEKSPGSGGPRA